MAKLPRLKHVKYVRAHGRVYAYFNSGQKRDGKPIYAPLPHPSAPGFYDRYAALVAGRTKRAREAYTIANLAGDYEDSADFRKNAANTQRIYRHTLDRIVDMLGKYPVNDLRREDLRMALDLIEGAGAHNLFLAVVGTLYRWARERDRTELDPTKDIRQRRTGEHAPWPLDVLESGLASDNDRIRLAVHLLYFTGQRIGDVCAMRWADIRGHEIYVTQEKTGKPLRIRIHRDLDAELARTPKRGLTILTLADGRPCRPATIRDDLKSLGPVVPHGLRKNAVNALLEAGCTVAETAAITGQTFAVVEHYARAVNQAKLGGAAILKLERSKKRKQV